MSISDKVHFWGVSLVHDTLYSLFRDPYAPLRAAGLRPGQRVLEVGCGPGFFTLPAAQVVGEDGSVCALDINPVAVDRVRRKVEEAGVTNVEVILADAAQTGLPDQSFDLAFVFGLRHSVGDLGKIFRELHRLLRPGGILAIEGTLEVPGHLFQPLERQGRISRFRKVG